jgi:hypothetical protein
LASGGRDGEGSMPQARCQRCDVLQVAVAVWRHGSVGGPTAENAKLKKLPAESMLDVSTLREMLEIRDGSNRPSRKPQTCRDNINEQRNIMISNGYVGERFELSVRVHAHQFSRPMEWGQHTVIV